jgi:cytochrome c oxidase subunit 4
MTTTADHVDDHAADTHDAGAHAVDAHDDHHPDSFYVKIAAILAAITGMEISLSYMHIGALFLPLLLILMAIKFFMVVLFFMHLKFDSKWFSFFFYTGLGLAVFVYCAFLATFRFFMSH